MDNASDYGSEDSRAEAHVVKWKAAQSQFPRMGWAPALPLCGEGNPAARLRALEGVRKVPGVYSPVLGAPGPEVPGSKN
nr:uncharacterized protein LOC106838399 isoform X2 [Equus asinus]